MRETLKKRLEQLEAGRKGGVRLEVLDARNMSDETVENEVQKLYDGANGDDLRIIIIDDSQTLPTAGDYLEAREKTPGLTFEEFERQWEATQADMTKVSVSEAKA